MSIPQADPTGLVDTLPAGNHWLSPEMAAHDPFALTVMAVIVFALVASGYLRWTARRATHQG
jgi:hypothetical protein